jgi:hypothetical protein
MTNVELNHAIPVSVEEVAHVVTRAIVSHSLRELAPDSLVVRRASMFAMKYQGTRKGLEVRA